MWLKKILTGDYKKPILGAPANRLALLSPKRTSPGQYCWQVIIGRVTPG
jgi:hypothetical protein